MAQLVARLVRNEKVGGSNPPRSTTKQGPDCPVFYWGVGAFRFVLKPLLTHF